MARTVAVETNPKTECAIREEAPFLRAYLRVYGRSQIEALEAARETRSRLADALPDCTCWAPAYKGFEERAGRHYAEVVVALGGDRLEAQGLLEALFCQTSSER